MALIVGRYEVLRVLGEGGMAVVHLARQPDLQRLIALKELRSLRGDDPAYAQRFLREARLAGSLTDPHVVTVYEYFEHEGVPYMAMEYVERGSLRPFVGQLNLPQIAGVLEGVLAGLMAAEQAGIVHRDLKPENVLVSADGRVKIADFGIAKATGRGRGHAPDRDGDDDRHAGLHGARAGDGRRRRAMDRSLQRRLPRVRAADRPAAVPRRRRGDGDPDAPRHRADPARQLDRARY